MTTFNPRNWPRLPDWLDPHEGRRSPQAMLWNTPGIRIMLPSTPRDVYGLLRTALETEDPVFWADQSYVGPAAIVNAHRFIVDSRDTIKQERLEIMADPDGVWRCRTIFNCVEACPRDIKITRAIMEVAGEIGRAGVR